LSKESISFQAFSLDEDEVGKEGIISVSGTLDEARVHVEDHSNVVGETCADACLSELYEISIIIDFDDFIGNLSSKVSNEIFAACRNFWKLLLEVSWLVDLAIYLGSFICILETGSVVFDKLTVV
jgi:hypothetical protein